MSKRIWCGIGLQMSNSHWLGFTLKDWLLCLSHFFCKIKDIQC